MSGDPPTTPDRAGVPPAGPSRSAVRADLLPQLPWPPSPSGGFFPIIRRWAVVVVVATGIAVVVGVLLVARSAPTYEARTELLVGPLNADAATVRAAAELVPTYEELAGEPATLEVVAARTGTREGDLRRGVRASGDPATRILSIRARAPSAAGAAEIADAVARRLVEQSGPVRPAAAPLDPRAPAAPGTLVVVDPAEPPSAPLRGELGLVVPLVAVAGLLSGLGLVMVLELLGDPAGTGDDVGRTTGRPTVVVPRSRGGEDPTARAGAAAATQLALVHPDARSVLLVATAAGDAAPGLGHELARAWTAATDGGEVVVVDGATAPAGRPDAGRAVVLAPPVAASSAALAWARTVDVTVLLVRRDSSRRRQVARTTEALRDVGAEVGFALVHAAGRGGAPTATPPPADPTTPSPAGPDALAGAVPAAPAPVARAAAGAAVAVALLLAASCSTSEADPPGADATTTTTEAAVPAADAPDLPELGGALAGLGALDAPPAEPALDRLVDAADEAVDVAPSAREPLLITDTEDDFVGDAQRAWTLALALRFTGDAAYGEAADAIVSDWLDTTRTLEETCPDSGGCSTSLMVSRAAPGFVFAADVLRSEGVWDEARTEEMHRWLADVILPAASDRDGNWGDAGTYMRAAVAAELGDTEELAAARDRWAERIDLIEADGQIPEEVRREDAGLMYSQEALGYKLATADILARNGMDVWDTAGEAGGSLRAALDLVAATLDQPDDWPVATDDLRVPRPAALWAIAAQVWPDQDAYRALAEAAADRDGGGHSAVMWTSVTHPVG